MASASSAAMQPDAHDFKVVVLGDKGVGKTCIVLRYIEGIFSHNTRSTIGAFFLTKKLSDINGYNRVNVQVSLSVQLIFPCFYHTIALLSIFAL